MAAAAPTSDNPYSFSVMTINMDGPGKASEKQDAVNLAIRVSNHDDCPFQPAIIFAQQIGAPKTADWKLDLKAYQYEYMKGSTSNEAGLLWLKEKFTAIKPYIDAGFKAKITDKFKNDASLVGDIPTRLNAVLLEHTTKTFKLLAVSWHGPNNKVTDARKVTVFEYLQKYVQKILEHLKDASVKCVLIGGDFNLSFTMKNLERSLVGNFLYKIYSMSQRRRKCKKQLIDNFLYTGHSLTLTELNVLEFQEPASTRGKLKWSKKDSQWLVESKEGHLMSALDHDPVLASVTIK